MVCHMDSLQNDDASLRLYLAYHFGGQSALASGDLTRLQRATKGARESPCGRGDDVVQSSVVGLMDIGVNTVALRYL